MMLLLVAWLSTSAGFALGWVFRNAAFDDNHCSKETT